MSAIYPAYLHCPVTSDGKLILDRINSMEKIIVLDNWKTVFTSLLLDKSGQNKSTYNSINIRIFANIMEWCMRATSEKYNYTKISNYTNSVNSKDQRNIPCLYN